MHVTIRIYRKVEGDKEQLMEAVNRGFVPLIAKIDGFVDYYAYFTQDGTLLSVSVYRDAKGADESVRAAAKWVEQNLAKQLPEKPELVSGETFAHRHVEQKAA